MKNFVVFYVIVDEGDEWQSFECQADDIDHAAEQCENAYPDCEIMRIVC